MPTSDRSASRFDRGWLLFWMLLSSVWCVSAGTQLSATSDEPVYLIHGMRHWRSGSYAPLSALGTMPLPVDVETLPFYLRERLRGLHTDAPPNCERILPWMRAMALPFWWLLLGYGWLSGRRLAGPWGGRLAVAALACEPTLLAHAGLATTDIALSACLLALVYHFRTGRDGNWLWRVGVPACWFGATVLAKASGLVFGPLCLAVVEAERLLRGEGERRGLARMWASAVDLGLVLVIGMALVFLYYPMAHEALWHQISRNADYPRATGTFLLGRWYPDHVWYYFPVALSIKLSVPLLLGPLVLGAVRPRALLNWAFLAGLGLVIFSLVCRVQIGVRLVLPLVGLWTVGLTAAVVRAGQTLSGWPRRLLVGAAAGAVAWTASAALLVWPEGLCYANPLWGGTSNAYHLLSDSNYDWGQGLEELARWQQRHAVGALDVWAVGPESSFARKPMRSLPLHALPVSGPADVMALIRGHHLAVSTSVLYGFAGDMPASRYLRSLRPVARTSTFLIYDFSQESGEQ